MRRYGSVLVEEWYLVDIKFTVVLAMLIDVISCSKYRGLFSG